MGISDWLFNPSGLTPHGFCLLWAPGLITLHALSDALIGIAYFSIPLALASFAARRKDIEYSWVIQLFVCFILACGTTHLMSILTLWVPVYGIEGIIKLVTAGLSVATAILLWPLIPKLVALPSPGQLAQVNAQLADRIREQERTALLLQESERQVRLSNAELERRVEARTAELIAANAKLTEALAQRDLLLREVYHRVKNNLQIIDSIVMLQSQRIEDPVAKGALGSLRSRLYALGLVHQQLMSSDDLKTFDVAPFLKELTTHIVEGSGGREVGLSVQAVPVEVGLDFAIPLGLVVTELVTNSLKHAFQGRDGHIQVILRRNDDGSITLVVSDDGQGTAVGATPTGLGTTILKGLIGQLRATLSWGTGPGTHAEIRIPAGSVA